MVAIGHAVLVEEGDVHVLCTVLSSESKCVLIVNTVANRGTKNVQKEPTVM